MSDDAPRIHEDPSSDALAEHARRLEEIVDDTEMRADCSRWVYEQFHRGRDADSLLADLLANGWPPDDAEQIVEAGRRATRHLRGCVTRDQIAAVAEKRYRNSFRIAFRMAIGGLPLMCGHFLLSLISFNRVPWPDRRRVRLPTAPQPPRDPTPCPSYGGKQ